MPAGVEVGLAAEELLLLLARLVGGPGFEPFAPATFSRCAVLCFRGRERAPVEADGVPTSWMSSAAASCSSMASSCLRSVEHTSSCSAVEAVFRADRALDERPVLRRLEVAEDDEETVPGAVGVVAAARALRRYSISALSCLSLATRSAGVVGPFSTGRTLAKPLGRAEVVSAATELC